MQFLNYSALKCAALVNKDGAECPMFIHETSQYIMNDRNISILFSHSHGVSIVLQPYPLRSELTATYNLAIQLHLQGKNEIAFSFLYPSYSSPVLTSYCLTQFIPLVFFFILSY